MREQDCVRTQSGVKGRSVKVEPAVPASCRTRAGIAAPHLLISRSAEASCWALGLGKTLPGLMGLAGMRLALPDGQPLSHEEGSYI